MCRPPPPLGFDDTEVEKLRFSKFWSAKALYAATREDLRAIGLPIGLACRILNAKGGCCMDMHMVHE